LIYFISCDVTNFRYIFISSVAWSYIVQSPAGGGLVIIERIEVI
jgi:hypothetical protein